MNYYIMKALTHNGSWFEFTMSDLPTLFNSTEFVLLGRKNTPKLYLKSIRRGDVDTGLYEGDVVSMDGCEWLICYERGFYAINADYVVKYLYDLIDYKFLGTCETIKSPAPINFREKHLFMYRDTIFRLNDIVGAYEGKLLLRSVSKPVDVQDIKQECCLSYKGSRLYIGSVLEDGIIEVHYGRVCLNKNGILTDVVTGGELNGHISRTDR